MKGRQIKVIAPLENFECARQHVDLSENLRIGEILDEDRELIWDASRTPTGLMPPHGLIAGLKYGLETSFKANEKVLVQAPDPSVIRTVYRAVSALRLYKAGNVGCNMLLVKNSNPSINFSGGLPNLDFPVLPGEYMLTEVEIEEFKKFWNKLKAVDTTRQELGFLDVARRRFNYAYERQKFDDKLIDHMISFESLFLTEQQELGLRLSLRAAVMLAEKSDKRSEVFSHVRTAYNLRSKIVHGQDPKEINDLVKREFGSFKELSLKMESYLRKSIRAFFEEVGKGNNKTKILQKLDETIFDKQSLTRESSCGQQ